MSSSLIAQDKENYLNESKEERQNRTLWFTDAKYGMFRHFTCFPIMLISCKDFYKFRVITNCFQKCIFITKSDSYESNTS